ncbi:hypothetical protein TNCV_3106521 [Trichonephila clavipes]|nr:hypothetical protein TNCV_3106521 [Trichonephila clavipes]
MVSSGGGATVTRGPKVVSWFWNPFQTSGTVPIKVVQGRHRASTSAQDRYLALGAQWHWRTTARQLAVVSGRRIFRQTIYKRLAETSLYARRPAWCILFTASSMKDRIL